MVASITCIALTQANETHAILISMQSQHAKELRVSDQIFLILLVGQ